MSNYHITQEQALEIWERIEPSIPLEDALQIYANAVLDKVLGEPVAFMLPSHLRELEKARIAGIGLSHQLAFAKSVTNGNGHSVALYAPKGLP